MKVDAEALFYLVAVGALVIGMVGYQVRQNAQRKRDKQAIEDAAEKGDLR